MKNAKMQIVKFDKSDVIATSSVSVTWTGLYDGTPGNATLTYKGIGYLGTTGKSLSDLNTALTGTGVSIGANTAFVSDNKSVRFSALTGTSENLMGDSTGSNPSKGGLYNTTFIWDSTNSKFVANTN